MLGKGIFSVFGAGLNAAMSSGAANEQWVTQLIVTGKPTKTNEIGRAHV